MNQNLLEALKGLGVAAEDIFIRQAEIDALFNWWGLVAIAFLVCVFIAAAVWLWRGSSEDGDMILPAILCSVISLMWATLFVIALRNYLTLINNPIYYYLEELAG